MASWLKSLFGEIRPNLLYDITKWLFLGALSMITAGVVYLYRSLYGQPRDIVLISLVFAVAFLLMATASLIARIGRKREREADKTDTEKLVDDYVAAVDEFADNRLKIAFWHLEDATDDIRRLIVAKMNAILEQDTQLSKPQKTAIQLDIAKEIAVDSARTEQLKRHFTDKIMELKAKGAKVRGEISSRR